MLLQEYLKMLKKKNAQGLSITTIVAAVIGLIIIVVIIAIMSGRLGSFSSGTEETATCRNNCAAAGMDPSQETETVCKATYRSKIVPGSFKDVSTGKVCCCKLKTDRCDVTCQNRRGDRIRDVAQANCDQQDESFISGTFPDVTNGCCCHIPP